MKFIGCFFFLILLASCGESSGYQQRGYVISKSVLEEPTEPLTPAQEE